MTDLVFLFQFETPSSTAETLFSIVNGDEIYATFALLDEKQTGGDLVPIIHGIYLGSFIAIFTIVVLNLLIALFTNAYDAVKVSTVLPAKSDNDFMFCLQSYQELVSDRSLVY